MKFLRIKNIVLVFILVLISLPSFAGKNHITIAGSTTIMPVSEKWAKAYKKKTGIVVNVHGGGSTSGIKATQTGTADIGASSRELNYSEKDHLKQIIIGKDALAVIVNKSNQIKDLNIDQVRGIFSGRIKKWNEVGGPDKPIQIINRESGSGTRDLFTEVIMHIMLADKTNKVVPMCLSSIVNNSNAEVKESVKLIPNSVGYISIGYVDNTVKPLTINSISPTPKNVYDGKYSLVRNLYYLFKEENDKSVQSFLAYVLSKEGQLFVTKEGFLPIVENNARD
jgi:phosphate transport system substrate-binding protein